MFDCAKRTWHNMISSGHLNFAASPTWNINPICDMCVCVFCVTTMFIMCTRTTDMMTPITNIYKRFKATRSVQTSLRCGSTIAQQTLSKHIPQLSKNLQLPISILKSRNSFNQHLTQILLEHSDIHIYIYPSGHGSIGSISIHTIYIHWSAILMFTRATRFWHIPWHLQIWHSMRNSPTTTEQVLNLWEKWEKNNIGLVYVRQVSLVRWT